MRGGVVNAAVPPDQVLAFSRALRLKATRRGSCYCKRGTIWNHAHLAALVSQSLEVKTDVAAARVGGDR